MCAKNGTRPKTHHAKAHQRHTLCPYLSHRMGCRYGRLHRFNRKRSLSPPKRSKPNTRTKPPTHTNTMPSSKNQIILPSVDRLQNQCAYRLLIGLNDRNGEPCPAADIAEAQTILGNVLDCYTQTEAVGVWHGKQEPTLIVEIIRERSANTHEQFQQLAARLAYVLNQECIAVSVAPLHAFSLVSNTAPRRA